MPKKIAAPAGTVALFGKLMDIDDALIRLGALPDSATLTGSEAAIFLRISNTQIDRLRVSGQGPAYMQGGSYGAKGTNQACTYHKRDLVVWQQSNKVTSAMQAAIKKGQTFATLFELAQPEAFYVDPIGNIEGMCERAHVATVVERLGRWDIAWMTPVEAASRPWSSLAAHQDFADEINVLLGRASSAVAAGVEATDIASSVAAEASVVSDKQSNRRPDGI